MKLQLFLRIKPKTSVTRLACQKEFNFCCKLRPNTSTTDSPLINKNPTPFPEEHPLSSTEIPNKRQPKCGVQRPTFDQRIRSKEPSTIPGEFPWMVAVLDRISSRRRNYEFRCAGSIIHPQVILTAAHYVKQYVEYLFELIFKN